MYKSDFFYQSITSKQAFHPELLSVWGVIADKQYYYLRDEDEQLYYPQDTLAFVRGTYGEGVLRTAKGTMVLAQNDFMILPLSDMIDYRANSPVWTYKWVNFLSPMLPDDIQQGRIYTVPCSEAEKKFFQDLLEQGNSKRFNPCYTNALFLCYMQEIMKSFHNEGGECPALLIDELTAYINQKIFSKLTVVELATHFNLTPRRVNQIFHEKMQKSTKEMIQNLKMEKAMMLLTETNISISEISYLLAYNTPYHFSATFKKQYGKPPVALRKAISMNAGTMRLNVPGE